MIKTRAGLEQIIAMEWPRNTIIHHGLISWGSNICVTVCQHNGQIMHVL